MKFEIKHRLTAAVMFTAEIECSADTPFNLQLGFAVRKAVEARAYLAGANLDGANLAGALVHDQKVKKLLASANRIAGGYTFNLLEMQDGAVKVWAGCRFMSIDDYRLHITTEYPGGERALATTLILDYFAQVVATKDHHQAAAA